MLNRSLKYTESGTEIPKNGSTNQLSDPVNFYAGDNSHNGSVSDTDSPIGDELHNSNGNNNDEVEEADADSQESTSENQRESTQTLVRSVSDHSFEQTLEPC